MNDSNSQNINKKKSKMAFLDHLEELRRRIILALLSIIVMAGVAGIFSDELFLLLIRPLGEIELHVTEVTGSFYAYLKVALVSGVLASLPIVFYQLWSFISPGLYKEERQAVLPLVFFSTLLFLGGAGFCFLIVLPLALKVLIGFSGDIFTPIITVNSYISFSGMLLMAFGVAFQLPVLSYFLGRVGLISARMLGRGRRYAIVIILIVSALFTPADVFTQILLALPLYFLYEISIIIVRLTGRKS